jgi:hypothetical protein
MRHQQGALPRSVLDPDRAPPFDIGRLQILEEDVSRSEQRCLEGDPGIREEPSRGVGELDGEAPLVPPDADEVALTQIEIVPPGRDGLAAANWLGSWMFSQSQNVLVELR